MSGTYKNVTQFTLFPFFIGFAAQIARPGIACMEKVVAIKGSHRFASQASPGRFCTRYSL
jgi:hypothetical protein